MVDKYCHLYVGKLFKIKSVLKLKWEIFEPQIDELSTLTYKITIDFFKYLFEPNDFRLLTDVPWGTHILLLCKPSLSVRPLHVELCHAVLRPLTCLFLT